jgi:hypothetical protein
MGAPKIMRMDMGSRKICRSSLATIRRMRSSERRERFTP